MRSEDMSTIFTNNLDYSRWKAKETTSGHGRSFLPSIRKSFAKYLRFYVEYRRK